MDPESCLYGEKPATSRSHRALGHTAGDDPLRTAAQRLLRAVAPDDVVGRFGGDQFVILIFGEATSGELQDMVARVRR
jgi:diguanylate cyclase (GGDEF)-like protein